MAWKLNESGSAHAHQLAKAGKVTDAPWDESTVPRDAAHANHFLAVDADHPPDQAGHYGFPVVNSGGELSIHAVHAAASRGSGTPIGEAAKSIGAMLSKKTEASMFLGCWSNAAQLIAMSSMPNKILDEPVFYAWKNAMFPREYKPPGKGFTLKPDVPKLEDWATKVKAMNEAGIPIPIVAKVISGAGDDHVVLPFALNSFGYVKDAKVEDNSLMLFCQLIGEQAKELAARNYVSVGIIPHYIDGTGRYWGDAITSLALTPNPVVIGQSEFQAASRQVVAGDMLFLSMTEPSRSNPMSTTLSDGQVGALRKHAHLCMSNVPDDRVGDHLVEHHARTEQQLSALCASMPGNVAQADALPNANGYVQGLSMLHKKLMPQNMSMSSKPEEVVSNILGRLDGLQKVGGEIDSLRASNESLLKEKMELSRQIPRAPWADAESELDTIELARQTVTAQLQTGPNPYPTATIDKLMNTLVTNDGKHAKILGLSRTANPGGSKALLFEIVDLLNEARTLGFAPGKTKTGIQMSRQIPDQDGATPEEKKAAKNALFGAMGVAVK